MEHTWSTYPNGSPEDNELHAITKRLGELLPAPITLTMEEIENLTDEQAYDVYRAARRTCLMQLLHQETHEHDMDDCGDYLAAASENWARLFDNLWSNDFQNLAEYVREFLKESPVEWGGSDGEVRFEILPEAYIDAAYEMD